MTEFILQSDSLFASDCHFDLLPFHNFDFFPGQPIQSIDFPINGLVHACDLFIQIADAVFNPLKRAASLLISA
jgi:hypothetical protein